MPIWTHDGETLYEGCVLATRHEQIWTYDPISTTYAEVWTGSEVKSVVVGGDMCRESRYAIDAGPEVRAAAADWLAVHEYMPQVKREARRDWESAVETAYAPHRGAEATVVRGRKVPVGTVGTIIWMGHSQYGDRVGIRTADGTVHWTAETNIRVTDPAPIYEPAPWAEYEVEDWEAYGQALDAARRHYGIK